jgi:hypothetical protein
MTIAARYEWLPLAQMKVDANAQRLLRPVWVKRHVGVFDPNQIGTIVISRRRDGSLWIIDGQHRVALLRAVEWGDQSVYCEVFDALTLQQEAALFLTRNDRISVRPFDKFKVGCTGEDEVGLAIASIVANAGLVIAEGNREGCVSAVTALERVYRGAGIGSEREGAIALRRALAALVAAWGKPSANFQGQIVEGVGRMFLRHAEIEDAVLVSVLRKLTAGATGLIGKARQLRDMDGGSLPTCVSDFLVKAYNRSRKSADKRLDAWTRRTTGKD